MHLFCFGLGYVSQAIISELSREWKVSGSHTGKRQSGANEHIFNNQVTFDSKILNDVTHILISIPPNDDGDPVFLSFLESIKNLPRLKWVGYFSSSSVYGDHQGNWVTEDSSVDPLNYLGRNRLIAEGQWLESGLPVNIMRLSAIYGPGRSVIESIRAKTAIRVLKEGHYFSRIHVEDISKIIRLMMDSFIPGEIYNIADDFPSAQHEVISFGCELLKVSPPDMVNFEEANLSEIMQRYYSSSKKISNQKIKNAYMINIKFPSYREGLLNCL